jgi:hypothetical protein
MAYILEKITPEDQERIIAEAVDDPPTQKDLIHARSCGALARTWAVDRERGYYLYFAPRLVREDSLDHPFYIRVKSGMYRIGSQGQIGYRMRFSESQFPVALLHELLDEIKAALAVYGAWGEGPLNGKNEPQDEVNPKFITIAES